MNTETDNLKKALSSLDIKESELGGLVRVLTYASKEDMVSYDELEEMTEFPEDTLLLANKYRLLIPQKNIRKPCLGINKIGDNPKGGN